MKKVGILGGTFDPPHLGHLLIAEEVYRKLALDEVWFIPSAEPPHKDKAKVSADERLEMLSAAIGDIDYFKINTIEIERKGKSYTFDTIKALQEDYPDHIIYFIIGADMVEYLPNWYRIDQLVKLVNFVGVNRKAYEIKTPYPVITVDTPIFDISSTVIRERLKENESIRFLVPESVFNIIKKKGLYGQKKST